MGRKTKKDGESGFISCPKSKNLSRKHVQVCRTCKSHKKCKAYQQYLQPLLPFRFR